MIVTFELSIDSGNEAFQDGCAETEIERILADINVRIGKRNLYDINGNVVGWCKMTKEDEYEDDDEDEAFSDEEDAL